MLLLRRVIDYKKGTTGFSTIELLVALSLFAVVSVAAIQFVLQKERSLIEGRNDLTIQQKNAAYCQSPTPSHEQICGHFREWGSMPNDPPVQTATSVSIDMETHNIYCKTAP